MKNQLHTVEEYELFLYTLQEAFPSIKQSTVILIRRGITLAKSSGQIHFDNGFHLVIRERLLFDRQPGVIDWYGYEVWKDDKKLSWYDSQPHPNDPKLESSHPHHKHIPPNINRNRIPAPHMSFTQPNLPIIIQEIEELIEKDK
ncbi:MAG: hypothetical protein GY940_05520 [bacterium]|nr:hypothetical protein [bacterium]